MSKFVFTFRAKEGRIPSAAEEVEWGKWFQELGSTVKDFGNRIGQSRLLGARGVPGGYVVVEADSLDTAVEIARGCPGLRNEGGVEVGEVIPAGA